MSTQTPTAAPPPSTIEDVTDAEVVSHGQDLVRSEPVQLAVTPQVGASELVDRLAVIREAMDNAMIAEVDYGVIPGTGSKPTLLKPGAEKLGVLFQLDVQLENVKTWGPDDHLTVVSRATAFHAPTGARVGYGEGVCTTRERKYAYRQQSRTCPACGLEAIIKGKEEYGGGWVCFKKKGGCGAKFPDGDKTIEGQKVGEIENPDLPDLWNTTVKMAEKRARVDVILAVTGASALFTQDVEDTQQPERTAESTPAVGPAYGKAAEEKQVASTRAALGFLLGCEPAANAVGLILNDLEKRAGGYLPHLPLAAIALAAKAVRDRQAPAEEPGEGDPAGETEEDRREREDAERIVAEVEAEGHENA
jgi:hypothetical protein